MEYSSVLDHKDIQILNLLQEDCSISNVDIGKQIGISSPTVHSRIKRLQQLEYITGYHAHLNPKKLGFDLQCVIHVNLQTHNPEDVFNFRDEVSQIPEVRACYQITGAYDYVLMVVVKNQDELTRLLLEKFTPIQCVARIQTGVVLNEVKSTMMLPIG